MIIDAPYLFDLEPDYTALKFPKEREFQTHAQEKLHDGWVAGHKNQMIMAPTGAGKTYLGLKIIAKALQNGRRAVFVCDRTTLIDQTSLQADAFGLIHHGVIQADHWRQNDMPFQIASAQTLARRTWPKANLIVVDEAHTQLSTWVDHIQSNPAKAVGLSATPFSKGLGKLFSNLINATTMNDITLAGELVPMRVFSCTKTDMRGAATAGGEWTDDAAAQRGMDIVGDVVTEWIKYGENRKTIVFGANIAHCEEICRQFSEFGVMSAVFTSKTSAGERKALLEEYRNPDSAIRILISVEALAKGFDVKDVSCVVDCRPLRKSLSTAIQMWGRGLRSSPDTGKTDCLLLDHSGNIIRFLDDYTEIFFNGLDALDLGEKLDKQIRRDDDEEKEIVACPSCGYKPFGRRCMSCGFEAKTQSLVEAQPGEMVEVMLGKKKLADDKRHLWEQLSTYAKEHSSPDKQQGRAWHLYKAIVGNEPPKDWRVATTPEVAVTRNTLGKIKQMDIAFRAGRAKGQKNG